MSNPTRKIMRPLTREDLNKYRDELATIVQEIAETESAKAAAVSQYGATLKEKKKQLNEVSRKIRERREDKVMDCEWRYYYLTGKKELYVIEDGDDTPLETADITEAEMKEWRDKRNNPELPLAIGQPSPVEPATINLNTERRYFVNSYMCEVDGCDQEWNKAFPYEEGMTLQTVEEITDDCPACGNKGNQPVNTFLNEQDVIQPAPERITERCCGTCKRETDRDCPYECMDEGVLKQWEPKEVKAEEEEPVVVATIAAPTTEIKEQTEAVEKKIESEAGIPGPTLDPHDGNDSFPEQKQEPVQEQKQEQTAAEVLKDEKEIKVPRYRSRSKKSTAK